MVVRSGLVIVGVVIFTLWSRYLVIVNMKMGFPPDGEKPLVILPSQGREGIIFFERTFRPETHGVPSSPSEYILH